MKPALNYSMLVTSFLLSCTHVYAEDRFTNQNLESVEMPIEVLAPYKGYDNTNNIEIVLHGSLPNPCYVLDEYRIDKGADGHTVQVRQFATRKTDGICGDQPASPSMMGLASTFSPMTFGEDGLDQLPMPFSSINFGKLPVNFQMTAPFTNVVSLGKMTAGDYTLHFTRAGDQLGKKSLNVREAHKTTIDDYPYASVSNLSASDVVAQNSKVNVSLSGVFTSSCAYLDTDSVKVEKQKDVYVVLPILKMRSGMLCAQSLTPFSIPIELEAPKQQGSYLVHVRSMNGKSINHVVQAIQ